MDEQEKQTKKKGMIDLPKEIVGKIFDYLPVKDRDKLSLACKTLLDISRDLVSSQAKQLNFNITNFQQETVGSLAFDKKIKSLHSFLERTYEVDARGCPLDVEARQRLSEIYSRVYKELWDSTSILYENENGNQALINQKEEQVEQLSESLYKINDYWDIKGDKKNLIKPKLEDCTIQGNLDRFAGGFADWIIKDVTFVDFPFAEEDSSLERTELDNCHFRHCYVSPYNLGVSKAFKNMSLQECFTEEALRTNSWIEEAIDYEEQKYELLKEKKRQQETINRLKDKLEKLKKGAFEKRSQAFQFSEKGHENIEGEYGYELNILQLKVKTFCEKEANLTLPLDDQVNSLHSFLERTYEVDTRKHPLDVEARQRLSEIYSRVYKELWDSTSILYENENGNQALINQKEEQVEQLSESLYKINDYWDIKGDKKNLIKPKLEDCTIQGNLDRFAGGFADWIIKDVTFVDFPFAEEDSSLERTELDNCHFRHCYVSPYNLGVSKAFKNMSLQECFTEEQLCPNNWAEEAVDYEREINQLNKEKKSQDREVELLEKEINIFDNIKTQQRTIENTDFETPCHSNKEPQKLAPEILSTSLCLGFPYSQPEKSPTSTSLFAKEEVAGSSSISTSPPHFFPEYEEINNMANNSLRTMWELESSSLFERLPHNKKAQEQENEQEVETPEKRFRF